MGEDIMRIGEVNEKGGSSNPADLTVVKTGPASVNAGATVTYELVTTNAGPSGATGVVVADTLADTLYVTVAVSEPLGVSLSATPVNQTEDYSPYRYPGKAYNHPK